MEGMTGWSWVYEPPASRCACRVPLLLTQKGEGWRWDAPSRLLSPFTLAPGSSPGQAPILSDQERGDAAAAHSPLWIPAYAGMMRSLRVFRIWLLVRFRGLCSWVLGTCLF